LSANHSYNSPSSPDDIALVRQLTEGDQDAFRQLYERYQPKLSRYLFPFVSGQPDLADDIIQEVFIKVWTKRDMLTGISVFEYYLQRMARNQLLDHIKLKKIQQKHETNYAVSKDQQQSDTVDFLQFKEYHQIAQRAMASLPERRKYLLRLSLVDGYSLDEIADMTRLSKAVVKKQLFKANRFMRDYIKEHGDLLLLIFFLAELP